jgi:hypothetical protein
MDDGGGVVLTYSIQGYDGDLAKRRQFTTQRPMWVPSRARTSQVQCDERAHCFESAGWLSDRAVHIYDFLRLSSYSAESATSGIICACSTVYSRCKSHREPSSFSSY